MHASDLGERPARRSDPAESIVAIVRFGVLALCGLLSLLAEFPPERRDLVALAVVAVLASIPLPVSGLSRARPIGEAALAAAIIGSTTPLSEPLLPYLVVPPLAAGLLSGVLASTTTTLVSLLVLITARWVGGDLTARPEVTLIAEWVGLGLATGLVGAWARSVVR